MRIHKDEMFFRVALALAARASCQVRQVGCVIVDEEGQIVSTGYNGRASGVANCEDQACRNGCEGVHAEVNALLRAGNRGCILYVTCAPCWHCIKAIINSKVKQIKYLDESTLESRSAALAWKCGIGLEKYTLPNQ